MHARPTAQRIDLKPRVVGENRRAQSLCVGNRLDPRIRLKSRAVLFRLGNPRIAKRHAGDPYLSENGFDLFHLVRI